MRRNNASIDTQNETLDLKKFNDIFSSGEENVTGSIEINKVNEAAKKLSPIIQENTLDDWKLN